MVRSHLVRGHLVRGLVVRGLVVRGHLVGSHLVRGHLVRGLVVMLLLMLSEMRFRKVDLGSPALGASIFLVLLLLSLVVVGFVIEVTIFFLVVLVRGLFFAQLGVVVGLFVGLLNPVLAVIFVLSPAHTLVLRLCPVVISLLVVNNRLGLNLVVIVLVDMVNEFMVTFVPDTSSRVVVIVVLVAGGLFVLITALDGL